jgi:ribosomal protein L40E
MAMREVIMAHRICNDCGAKSSLPYVVCLRCHGKMMPDPAYELNDAYDDNAPTDRLIDEAREAQAFPCSAPWWKGDGDRRQHLRDAGYSDYR